MTLVESDQGFYYDRSITIFKIFHHQVNFSKTTFTYQPLEL